MKRNVPVGIVLALFVAGCAYGRVAEVPLRDEQSVQLIPVATAVSFLNDTNRFQLPKGQSAHNFLVWPVCKFLKGGVLHASRVTPYDNWSLSTFTVFNITTSGLRAFWGRLDNMRGSDSQTCIAYWRLRGFDETPTPTIRRLVEALVALGVRYSPPDP